ncbi:hypothetical protein [Campylobacter showae]|uniref:hypothetical protein n=1 Tax=Campylobacter showae TaxID=204 RepID=UPI001E416765|nr:hypothetical protein [Campylobacter showae]
MTTQEYEAKFSEDDAPGWDSDSTRTRKYLRSRKRTPLPVAAACELGRRGLSRGR